MYDRGRTLLRTSNHDRKTTFEPHRQIEPLNPVEILGLHDEMFPVYRFLKQRLLSIQSRFKIGMYSYTDVVWQGKIYYNYYYYGGAVTYRFTNIIQRKVEPNSI